MALKTPSKPAVKKAAKKPAKKAAPVKARPKAKLAAKKVVKKAAPKKSRAVPGGLPVGRPSLYRAEYCDLATNYCLLGATDKQLAGYFGIDVSTLGLWKHAHPEFVESIEAGRDKADALIAKSLYQRAKGYSHEEDDIRTLSVGMGRSELVITPTTKHYPPDTAAASLWLRNRQSKRWRDKVEVDHSGSVGFDKAPIEELQGALADLLAKLK